MSDREMLMVFCYDISDRRTRERVARFLEDRAVRVQESVFQARLSKSTADSIFDQLNRTVDETDSVRMYGISASGLERSRANGSAPVAEEGDFWIV